MPRPSGVLFESLVDDLFQLGREAASNLPGRHRGLIDDSVENRGRGGALEREHSRRHLVHHDSERKQVGAGIELFAEPRLVID